MTTRRTKVDAMIAGMERKVLLLLRVVTIVADSDFVFGGGSKRSRLRQFGGKKSAIEKLSRQFGGKESAIEIDSSILAGRNYWAIAIARAHAHAHGCGLWLTIERQRHRKIH